jgi:hypothetical protein
MKQKMTLANRKCCEKALTLVLVGSVLGAAHAEGLPSTEQFGDMLVSCAAGANVEIKADLIGSIKTIYDGQRTQGAASFQSSTEFLKLIPESSRLEAYKLYTRCIGNIINKQR